MKKHRIIIGVDEAGRGPLAGPLAVAAAATEISNFQFLIFKKTQNLNFKFKNSKLLKNIKDSKKLSAGKREYWEKIIKKNFESHYVFVSHKTIDRIGINKATLLGVQRVLKKFSQKPVLVLLDGLLRAPDDYKQKTIIKGDEKVPLISAASIIAKVARDKKMVKLHKKFSQYCFDVHKGYGTMMHYKKIKQNGLSAIHRKSFCKKLDK